MNFSLLVARRYLFAKKSHNAVNVISTVSVVGVAVGTIALVIVLSVFNGFEDLTKMLYNTFDPDLKITATVGKSFVADAEKLQQLKADPGVQTISQTIEENVMLRYGEQQEIAIMKGVDDQYQHITGIDTMLTDGEFKLWINDRPQSVVGEGVAAKLHIRLNFITPIHIYVIRNMPQVSMDPQKAINDRYIYPSGEFAIDEEINSQYLLVPLEFARELFENESITGAIEVKLKPGVDVEKVQERIAAIFGKTYEVKTRYQQKAFEYKIIQSEKWISFMILVFVLLIASFNVVGSLSMLMIEKKNDMSILKSLGADKQKLGLIFIIQGWMIVIVGVIAGMIIGALVCLLQMKVGIVPLSSSGTFIIDYYPVALQWADFVMILVAVTGISFFTIYFPVKYFVKKNFA